MAMNNQQVFSYAWDVNSGNMQYLAGEGGPDSVTITPSVAMSAEDIMSPENKLPQSNQIESSSLIQDDEEDIEF